MVFVSARAETGARGKLSYEGGARKKPQFVSKNRILSWCTWLCYTYNWEHQCKHLSTSQHLITWSMPRTCNIQAVMISRVSCYNPLIKKRLLAISTPPFTRCAAYRKDATHHPAGDSQPISGHTSPSL